MSGPQTLQPQSLIYWYWGFEDVEEANKGQKIGKYSADSNEPFRLVNCIQNMMYGELDVDPEIAVDGGSDWVKCSSIALFTVTSITLIVLFGILLSIQLKKYGLQGNCMVFKKLKTWCLINPLILLTFIFFDNLLTPFSYGWATYTILQALICTMRQLTALTLFSYFLKRAKKLMMAQQIARLKCVQRVIIVMSVCCILGMFALFIVQIVKVAETEPDTDAR